MSRTNVFTALVLRNRPSGQSNSTITLLTAEEGLISATLFGGPKSKLKAHAAPYNSGKVWIYRDKARQAIYGCQDYAKISDFDVQFWRPGIRELYERTMTASALAETIMFSHGGGGDWQLALELAIETLDTLENANEELCSRLFVHFLWRWAAVLGIQPVLDVCAACGENANTAPLYFNTCEGAALCASCSPDYQLSTSSSSSLLLLNPGCRRWLSTVGELESSHLYRFSMDNKSFHEAKTLVTAVLSGALGKRLNSWNW